jgi:hypothetical protein
MTIVMTVTLGAVAEPTGDERGDLIEELVAHLEFVLLRRLRNFLFLLFLLTDVDRRSENDLARMNAEVEPELFDVAENLVQRGVPNLVRHSSILFPERNDGRKEEEVDKERKVGSGTGRERVVDLLVTRAEELLAELFVLDHFVLSALTAKTVEQLDDCGFDGLPACKDGKSVSLLELG